MQSGRKKTYPAKKKATPARKRSYKGKKRPVVKLNWWSIAAIVALLAFLIVRPLLERDDWEHGTSVPASFHGDYGIDISHNNRGTIVWDSLMVMTDRSGRTVKDMKAARNMVPVSFVFIKATEGQSMVDKKFRTNWKAAAEHGLQRGAYHFYRTSKDPHRQAQSFIRTVGALRHGDLPPVLDIETTHNGLTKARLNADLQVWLREVEAHYGRKPVIYTYESFARDYLSREITSSYPIWIAHYDTERPDREDWQYWQFTDRALVYGIEDPVDLSLRRK